MSTQPSSGGRQRAVRLNLREVYPVHSTRHPHLLATPPSDAVAVIWLDPAVEGGDPRFAYLNSARLGHLITELSRIQQGSRLSSVDRARRILDHAESEGQVSGA